MSKIYSWALGTGTVGALFFLLKVSPEKLAATTPLDRVLLFIFLVTVGTLIYLLVYLFLLVVRILFFENK
jgi:hypothetical protein